MIFSVRKIVGNFDYLGARHSAELIKARIVPLLACGIHVELDFSEVEGVSHSFADELIGVFLREQKEELAKLISIKNASSDVKDALNAIFKIEKGKKCQEEKSFSKSMKASSPHKRV